MKSRNTILKDSEISLKVISLPDLNTLTDILLDSKVKETYMIPDMDKNDAINFSKRLMDLSNNLDLFIYGIYANNNLIGLLNQVDRNEYEIELGYFISSKYWNKGYATIALKLAIDKLFRIGYKRVMAAHFENNIASARVMQKCGMQKIDKIEELEYRGILHKCIYYAIDGNNESIIGDNIILRCAQDNDYLSMLKVWGDKDVYQWMLFTPTVEESDAKERNKRSMEYQKSHYAYYIAKKDTNKPIGLCAIKEYEDGKIKESGIAIAIEYQGLGYGKEVLKLLLDLAFNKLDAKSFQYGYFIDNIKSKRLAEYFHFQYGGIEEMVRPHDQEKKITELCILKREDYIK
jgi:RimJ/RimL family protein N-acetyltransferase